MDIDALLNYNYRKIELTDYCYGCYDMRIFLVVPITPGEGKIRLKIVADRCISIPGTLDENVYFLVCTKESWMGDKMCPPVILKYVPVTAWTEEGQVINLRRFLIDECLDSENSITESVLEKVFETEPDTDIDVLKSDRYHDEDSDVSIRKNGILSYSVSEGAFEAIMISEEYNIDFFKGAVKIGKTFATGFSFFHFLIDDWGIGSYIAEMIIDFLENKEIITSKDLRALYETGWGCKWKLYTENGKIECTSSGIEISKVFEEGTYDFVTYSCFDVEYWEMEEAEKERNVENIWLFLCAILKCDSLQACLNAQCKAEMLDIIKEKR